MRIAVMAAGAVGGYFGGRMAAAGHDVAFIARGAHRDAIRWDGLKIESALGDLHLKDVNVTDDPTQVGPVDVVLFAVKLWDTETAGEQTCPLPGPESRVITLQNGVDSVERLAPILGEGAAIAGTTYVVTTIARPGVIHHTGTTARIHCGRLDSRPDAILADYVEQMKAANVDITLTENMLLDIWKKFVLLSGTSGMTASTRKSLGLIREDADMRALLFKLMHETTAVGRAAGVDLPEDFATELDRSIFHDFFAHFAEPAVLPYTDFLVKWGQLLIGLSLVSGLLVRLSGPFGILLMVTYYFAHMDWPFIENHLNLWVDFHLVYAIVIVYLIAHHAGRVWGLDGAVEPLPVVAHSQFLKSLFAAYAPEEYPAIPDVVRETK